MKSQQETMALQTKAGASPMAGLFTGFSPIASVLCVVSVFSISVRFETKIFPLG